MALDLAEQPNDLPPSRRMQRHHVDDVGQSPPVLSR
jgi:hypothetical protein